MAEAKCKHQVNPETDRCVLCGQNRWNREREATPPEKEPGPSCPKCSRSRVTLKYGLKQPDIGRCRDSKCNYHGKASEFLSVTPLKLPKPFDFPEEGYETGYNACLAEIAASEAAKSCGAKFFPPSPQERWVPDAEELALQIRDIGHDTAWLALPNSQRGTGWFLAQVTKLLRAALLAPPAQPSPQASDKEQK